MYDLFTFSEGTTDQTETSAIFAGTNSEIEVKKKPKSKSYHPENDLKALAVKPEPKKNLPKIDTMKVIYQEEENSQSKKEITASKSLTEREKLLEKVRKISMKIAKKDTHQPEAEYSDNHSKHAKKKHKKKKKKKYAKFEGERISHLDKSDTYKPPVNIEEKNSSKDDDYVLSKLFKKSGVHSALQHDVIMNGERGPDFALIGKKFFYCATYEMIEHKIYRTKSLIRKKNSQYRIEYYPDLTMFPFPIFRCRG